MSPDDEPIPRTKTEPATSAEGAVDPELERKPGTQVPSEAEPEPEAQPEPEPAPEPDAETDLPVGDGPADGPPSPADHPPEVTAPDAAGPVPEIESTMDGIAPAGDKHHREELVQPEPLALGSVIGERYAVAEVLEAGAGRVRYRTLDLIGCPACGGEQSAPDDAFCASCGADRVRKLSREIVEVHGAGEENLEAELDATQAVEARWQENERLYLVLSPPKSAPARAMPGLRFAVGQRSDPGLVRELDEDSLLAITLNLTCEACTGLAVGLFAVADGMGGHAGGEVASRIALQVLGEEVIHRLLVGDLTQQAPAQPGENGPSWNERAALEHLREAVVLANDQVYLERHRRNNDMGTTLTAALVRGDRLLIAHVGDCRAYRWGAGGLEQLTSDHSIVASLAEAGQIEPDAIYTHPQRSVIYRCIGDQPQLEVDTRATAIAPGERLVLCCDGLWELVRSEGIEEVMLRESDPQAACDQLVRYANQAGGDDNISVIVVQIQAV